MKTENSSASADSLLCPMPSLTTHACVVSTEVNYVSGVWRTAAPVGYELLGAAITCIFRCNMCGKAMCTFLTPQEIFEGD